MMTAFGLLTLVACEAPPIDWSGSQVASPLGGPMQLSVDGRVHLDTLTANGNGAVAPPDACPGSLRVARGAQSLVAVWWSVRPDSGADLVFGRLAADGASWQVVSRVDTTDHGVSGCRRAAASVAFDAASGYVHVSYGLVAAEGPGVFFSHSMDGGATFHSPVPIVYGEHPGQTTVAASGDVVVVAFEDPNGSAARVGLALSRSMGHIFERRVLPVSGDNGAATVPLAAVQGSRVAVAWEERGGSNGAAAVRIRTGSLH